MFSGGAASVDDVTRLQPSPVDPLQIYSARLLEAWSTGQSLVPFNDFSSSAIPPSTEREVTDILRRAMSSRVLPFEVARLMLLLQSNCDIVPIPPAFLHLWLDQGNADLCYVYVSALGMRSVSSVEP